MSINIFEPEETVGYLWHKLVGSEVGFRSFPQEKVLFESNRHTLSLLYRAMGGKSGVELKSVPRVSANFRLRLIEKIGHDHGAATIAHYDGDYIYLPEIIDVLPNRDQNASLFRWLAAYAAALEKERQDGMGPRPTSVYAQDMFQLREIWRVTGRLIDMYPGLRALRAELGQAFLALREPRPLPPDEQAVELCLLWIIGGKKPTSGLPGLLSGFIAGEDAMPLPAIEDPKNYKTFLPLPLWVENREPLARSQDDREDENDVRLEGDAKTEEVNKAVKAKRQKADQIARRDSILLYPFSGLLSFAAMLNINRKVEDDDAEQAKKALDDQDEIGLVKLDQKASTRLCFDLDMSPSDIDAEKLSAPFTYPEWDYRNGILMPDHTRVLENSDPQVSLVDTQWQADEAARRRIAQVRRQFEALRPRREVLNAQMDGPEFDMESLVRSQCDMAANHEGSDRIYRMTRPQMRDLAVAVLMDVSRSTESWVEGRQVIEIAREALFALSMGLTACGDSHALYGFSSLKRNRVLVDKLKDYDESFGPHIASRIGALKPRFYTRMGAGIRHVAEGLRARPNSHRLLLVITDGKPNDLDHYEGRYGIEDTANAIRMARQQGMRVFGITIDAKAQGYFPHMFGTGGYAIVSHPDKLVSGLPVLYRHLIQG